ncbi:hypothetical protein QQF21_17590 [Lelliottia sp. V89_10]|uniref:hypothetical protein n=1 Tax=Lelliottia wanjuensis TaxID=3050585 RepID=UPI00249D9176|nr:MULTISPECIES: hypothetical protein [unclassified Lelliottia]MDI3361195.1 hypothetical protein [Lelliottia sp. V89_13]MDK9551294.1 hypothetical protein [Lelliottia sp. V89_5]MDK9597434.1 hypothetical protein [Lelliottia sp. V89_10]
MYHLSNKRLYSRDELIRKLSKSEKNYIAVYWSGVNPGDGCFTGGVNLVTHNPYYAGWAPSLEEDSEYITSAELELVKDVCDANPWGKPFGGKCLGGTEYRLKPELRAQQ